MGAGARPRQYKGIFSWTHDAETMMLYIYVSVSTKFACVFVSVLMHTYPISRCMIYALSNTGCACITWRHPPQKGLPFFVLFAAHVFTVLSAVLGLFSIVSESALYPIVIYYMIAVPTLVGLTVWTVVNDGRTSDLKTCQVIPV